LIPMLLSWTMLKNNLLIGCACWASSLNNVETRSWGGTIMDHST
jgi:hypothetical protein